MPRGEKYLAFDLGAESGRALVGTLTDRQLQLEEVHRFANQPVPVLGSLYCDVLHLWQEMRNGLQKATAVQGGDLAGIGVDAWGVDYGLIDCQGKLLGNPYHYRDARTDGILDVLHKYISAWELYSRTGLTCVPVSTLCQLLASRREQSSILQQASTLLMIPNLFLYWLSGRQVTEVSIAGTTQFFDLSRRTWCRDLLERLNLPSELLTEIVPSATVLAKLLPAISEEMGIHGAQIIAPACHDTAAAVAAVPSRAGSPVFISCGTWSVMGRELSEPLLTPEAMRSQFLNEMGACGYTLFVRNLAGLWPLQECRREWLRQGRSWSYDELIEMAVHARPFAHVIDPDDASFAQPGDMTPRIAAYCRRTGQETPTEPGQIVRGLLEGLALRYRQSRIDLERLTGQPVETIHIVGGGSRNALLCQLTANATERPVLAGPAEATAIANVLLQALARGSLSSLAQVRQIVGDSCKIAAYVPNSSSSPWEEATAALLR